MGHKYSLVLSRKITDEESAILLESGCHGATFATDSLPTDPEFKVTRVNIDDTVSPSLEEAIQSGLDAVIRVPDLSVPGLHVPALPVAKKAGHSAVVAGEVMDDEPSAGGEVSEVEAAEANPKGAANGKAGAKRAANGKASPKRAANGTAGAKRTVNRKAPETTDDARELSEAGAAAD